jgi:hypothetical protein
MSVTENIHKTLAIYINLINAVNPVNETIQKVCLLVSISFQESLKS